MILSACASGTRAPDVPVIQTPDHHVRVQSWFEVQAPYSLDRAVAHRVIAGTELESIELTGHDASSAMMISLTELPALRAQGWDREAVLDDLERSGLACHTTRKAPPVTVGRFVQRAYDFTCNPHEDLNSSELTISGREVLLATDRQLAVVVLGGNVDADRYLSTLRTN